MEEADLKEKSAQVFKRLKKANPEARIELKFRSPLELLVATILSAQCTDVRVNQVTATLFKKYKKPADYLKVPAAELEDDIRSTGFYRQKAKSLRGVMEGLLENHKGTVPAEMDALTTLPGVGRKTANVVLGNAFHIPGIVVDTHVGRVSQRIGLSSKRQPDKIERDLNNLFPQKQWTQLSHILIFHGRYTCKARNPLCEECAVSGLCDFYAARAKA
ncbi:MAG: endonuclease III [bacterium]|nr:endonuclease III [bacterium]